MASFLFKLGSFCFRHKWSVIAAWLAALIAVAGLVGALQPKFAQDFSLPGTDSGVATEQVEQYFPQVMAQQEQASTSILVAAEGGLQNHTTQLRYRWGKNDLAVWDNRATQHYAVADYDDHFRRLSRVTLAGDIPVDVHGDHSRAIRGDASTYSQVVVPVRLAS